MKDYAHITTLDDLRTARRESDERLAECRGRLQERMAGYRNLMRADHLIEVAVEKAAMIARLVRLFRQGYAMFKGKEGNSYCDSSRPD